jgi:GT2 family glycosyltransferase
MMATLDIIVPNWNSGTQLRTCLDSIARADRNGVKLQRVLVVDNASSDGSTDSLNDFPLPVVCLQNDTNRGFAAACNQGAASSHADYLLFLNPDTRLLQDSLTKPIAFMEARGNEQTGIVGIQFLNDGGAVSVTCARFPSLRRFLSNMLGLERVSPRVFPGLFMLDWDHTDTREVDQVIGAFFLVRRILFERLGGFDERFFVYFEEVDFSLRARRAGWRTVYLATARAYHRGGGTTEQIKPTRLFYNLRSRILYGYKHFSWTGATVLAITTLFFECFTRLARGTARGSLTELFDTTRGYTMLWRALPTIARTARQLRGV